jgi:signal transduction histidine kinase
VLEWTNIYPNIDIYGDYIEVFQPLVWLFLFYEFIQEISKEKIKKSQQRYIDAFNRLDFHKDLIAHDMANILNNIKSALRILEIYEGDPSKSDKKRELNEIISKQVKRGENLISNMKKLSKIENQDRKIKSINIGEMIRNAIKNFKSQFKMDTMEISVDIPDGDLIVKGGPLLADAFDNLLLNAYIHNNSQQKKVWINLTKIQEKQRRFIKIEFIDNGVGINKERKETIFNRDYKQEKSTGGMGIGLSLVKKIVKQYRGQVQVKNRIEGDFSQGSDFIIILEQLN